MICRLASLLAAGAALLSGQPPKLRLDDSIRPVRYAVDLTLRPDAATFSGSIDIDIDLQKPAGLIWLNATDITIQQVTVTSQADSRPATVEPGDGNFTALRLPPPAAGAARIHIVYQGKVNEKNSSGVFRGKDGSENYLFTDFEPTSARRAFPCFDQPNFKTPWQLTLHIPGNHIAVANSPQASNSDEPDGMRKIVFAPTKPLPSYLVAFAVGPFEVVDGGVAGRNRVPVRVITPKGKAANAAFAAGVTGSIIEQLENYFGIPYPYEKADSISIPGALSFGAMENAGLVTYAETILLANPAIDTEQRRRNYTRIAAHELAHQWFGDLVTLAWWDDTWLNEAFATWTSSKLVAESKPVWSTRLADLGEKFIAMNQDSLLTARKIRQPIESMDDVANAFDDITYQKGSAVIRMFESWVGEKQFQSGVNRYLKQYANENATGYDFLDSISAAGQPRLTGAFRTFLEQTGFPQINAEMKCGATPRLAVSQKRYLPVGSAGSSTEIWQVPVCVRYESPRGPQTECFLLDRAQAEFSLTKTSSCPTLYTANDSAVGYYVTAYPEAHMRRLIESGSRFLTPAERRTLLYDMRALVKAGEASESQVLEAVPQFAEAPEREIVTEAQNATIAVRRTVPAELRPNYARYIRKAFGQRAADLGWSVKSGEDAEASLLRATLLPFVAVDGNDPVLQTEARQLADQWLKDGSGVAPAMVRGVLSTAATNGDRKLFDAMLAGLKKTQDRQLRSALISAIGSFRDAATAREAMGLVLLPDYDPREVLGLAFGAWQPDARRLPFEFVTANYDALLKRLPAGGASDARARLLYVGGAICDAAGRAEFEAFFKDRAQAYEGGPRNYAQVLESIRLCEAQRATQGAGIAAFFSRQ